MQTYLYFFQVTGTTSIFRSRGGVDLLISRGHVARGGKLKFPLGGLAGGVADWIDLWKVIENIITTQAITATGWPLCQSLRLRQLVRGGHHQIVGSRQ